MEKGRGNDRGVSGSSRNGRGRGTRHRSTVQGAR
jgi:hypothetical protein